MPITKTDWRTEYVSDAVRIVTGEGRSKIILARLNPKQIPETETAANAELMTLSPRLLEALNAIVDAGLLSGYDHPVDLCRCANCVIRRLVRTGNEIRDRVVLTSKLR